MSRSLIFLAIVLGAVLGPIWWFDSSRKPDQSAQVPPPVRSTGQFQQRLPIFSSTGFSREESPAQFPQSEALPNAPLRSNPFQQAGAITKYVPFDAASELPAGTQTFVFPGNANGPDLTNGPLTYHPEHDIRRVFRFDLTPMRIKQRWDRVTSQSIGRNYRSFRVALVTGVNPWDLHGSLTYYFDQNQSLQRISFKGWTGDATHFLKVMNSSINFESLPTQWAGAYEARRNGFFKRESFAGILMREPAVIRSSVPNERMAIVMELNNPQGNLSLSKEFLNLKEQAVR